jgi:hypothetical protein
VAEIDNAAESGGMTTEHELLARHHEELRAIATRAAFAGDETAMWSRAAAERAELQRHLGAVEALKRERIKEASYQTVTEVVGPGGFSKATRRGVTIRDEHFSTTHAWTDS